VISAAYLILALVTLQRLGELVLAERNSRRLLAEGAYEVGRAHYPFIVAVHAGWLTALWWLAPGNPIHAAPLLLFVTLQAARIWVVASLGRRWTTRIIVLPGAPLVRGGPYRWVKHPNYWVVAGEIALLPLAFGLAEVAIVFSLLNAAVLLVRIREENKALAAAS
jgi:isoprenylcysteine carboxyl methyltransferase (ICMT) family protein YpbQ